MPSSTPRAAVTRRLARAAVATAAAAITVAAFSTPAAAAEADGGAAAGWLAAQAVDGHYTTPGTTADAVVALVSADAGSDVTADAIAWLSTPSVLGDYIGNGTDGYKAAQVAKIMLAADAAGADVNDFGGVDLEAALRGLEGDDGLFGDSATVLSQSLAILSLERTDGGAPAAAVTALAGKQCDTGSYGFTFTSCDDPDATGYATSALLAAGDSAAESLDWLESQQHDNGAFVAGFPGAPENTNSTGVAGQALASGGRDAAAGKAREFIATLQNGCDTAETDRGGIAYDASGFDPGNAVMSTSQAILAVTGEGLAELDPSDDTADLPVLDCDGSGDGSGDGDTDGDGSADVPGDDAASELPVTGGSLTLPIVLGAATVLTGAALVYGSRRLKAAGRSS